MPKSPSRLPLALGLLLVVAGWVALYLAWNKTSTIDLEAGQIPLVVSGGLGGLGLLLLGVAGLVVDAVQRAAWQSRAAMQELIQAIEKFSLNARLTESRNGDEPATPAAKPRRRRAAR